MEKEIVRAANADCKCEHGYKSGEGFSENRCVENASYWSKDESLYLCAKHASDRTKGG